MTTTQTAQNTTTPFPGTPFVNNWFSTPYAQGMHGTTPAVGQQADFNAQAVNAGVQGINGVGQTQIPQPNPNVPFSVLGASPFGLPINSITARVPFNGVPGTWNTSPVAGLPFNTPFANGINTPISPISNGVPHAGQLSGIGSNIGTMSQLAPLGLNQSVNGQWIPNAARFGSFGAGTGLGGIDPITAQITAQMSNWTPNALNQIAGYPIGQQGFNAQSPFAQNPFAQSQFAQSPFGVPTNPLATNHLNTNLFNNALGNVPFAPFGGQFPFNGLPTQVPTQSTIPSSTVPFNTPYNTPFGQLPQNIPFNALPFGNVPFTNQLGNVPFANQFINPANTPWLSPFNQPFNNIFQNPFFTGTPFINQFQTPFPTPFGQNVPYPYGVPFNAPQHQAVNAETAQAGGPQINRDAA